MGEAARTQLIQLTADDVISGLFAGLIEHKYHVLKTRRVLSVLTHLLPVIQEEAERHCVSLQFRICPNQLHGDSGTVRSTLITAIQRGMITTDAPRHYTLRVALSGQEAHLCLAHLPGPAGFYEAVTKHFIARYFE